MRKQKQKRLRARGWKMGTVKDFWVFLTRSPRISN